MALIHSFEKSGNWLFKHRGELPVILFVLAIPALYFNTVYVRPDLLRYFTWAGIGISILGFVVRAWAIGTTPKGTSGRNTHEGQVANVLNTTGIYSLLRHPLYLGNYLMWMGILVFTFNPWFVIIVSLGFWLYYERIMFAEERFLERKFGKPYLDWSMDTPAFLPAFRKFKRSNIPFSLKTVLRREYSGVLATVFGFVYIDLLRAYFHSEEIRYDRTSLVILYATLFLTVTLRSLKHYTKWLDEAGRS